jgi:hypothetical protein
MTTSRVKGLEPNFARARADWQRAPCRGEWMIVSSIRVETKRTLQIRNERVVQLATKLAAIRRSTKTEAVR